ncbi:hypothetical protein OG292_08745 [Streptomyces sp. NBC_01511]|uniref:hypothetical protein n=1 Tax=Streptomyces sp. NBC_01511 TaxID=2903889 RepID=UPI003869E5F8
MSDDKKPPLSPQEQQQSEETAQIESEFGATDAAERMAMAMDHFGFGNMGGFFSRTSFEDRGLNDMLDLLDGANPSDLEHAGKNLERAKKSLNAAAEDLSEFVKATDWRGEAATEFERYGTELVRYAWDLGSFANVVGTQMSVAATGLTSVRSSKPPRDNRADRRAPKDFPVTEQREDNPEYKQAVKAEEHRQEAINQMNRLASFYAVSEQSLAGAKEPALPKMLAADVPRPAQGAWGNESGSGESGGTGGLGSSPQQASAVRADAGGTGGIPRTATDGLVTQSPTSTPTPPPSTSMQIDTVNTLPPTTTGPGPAQPSTVPPGPTSNSHVPPPLGPNFGPPVRGGPRSGPPLGPRGGGPVPGPNVRTGTGDGGRQGPVGRPSVMGGGGPNTGGSQSGRGPVGRPTTTMGPGGGRGGDSNANRSPMVGRPSAGGPPMGGRSGQGSSTAPRTGRANGIVGGTPQRTSGGGTGASGSRIPRGNVIGGAGSTTPGRPVSAARPSQSGVVGAGPAQGAARPTGRGMPSSNGVVGTPRSGGTPPRAGAGGFTTGGSGLSGDRQGQQTRDEQPERPGQQRPEPRADDTETRAGRRRGAVPPVID